MSRRIPGKSLQALAALGCGWVYILICSLAAGWVKVRVDAFDCVLTSESVIVPVVFGLGCLVSASVGQAFRLSPVWNSVGAPVILIAGLVTGVRWGGLGTSLLAFEYVVAEPIGASPLVLIGLAGCAVAVLASVCAHFAWKHTPRLWISVGCIILCCLVAGGGLLGVAYYQMRAEVRASSDWAQRVVDAATGQRGDDGASADPAPPGDGSSAPVPKP